MKIIFALQLLFTFVIMVLCLVCSNETGEHGVFVNGKSKSKKNWKENFQLALHCCQIECSIDGSICRTCQGKVENIVKAVSEFKKLLPTTTTTTTPIMTLPTLNSSPINSNKISTTQQNFDNSPFNVFYSSQNDMFLNTPSNYSYSSYSSFNMEFNSPFNSPISKETFILPKPTAIYVDIDKFRQETETETKTKPIRVIFIFYLLYNIILIFFSK